MPKQERLTFIAILMVVLLSCSDKKFYKSQYQKYIDSAGYYNDKAVANSFIKNDSSDYYLKLRNKAVYTAVFWKKKYWKWTNR